MAWYLMFWRNRSTGTLVPAASASQARSRAERKQKQGYWAIVAARLDGTIPQFGSVRSKARARRQRSSYRHWPRSAP